MLAANHIKIDRHGIRIRPVALPVEHGGWGLVLEPIVLGLLLAPSLVGLLLSITAMGAFFARHPLKLAAGDRRLHRRSKRTALAERFALLYLLIATLALALAIKSGGAAFLLPLLLASPFAIMQLSYDSLGRSRALIAELAGSISIGAVATAIALAGDWQRPAAFGLWAILAARTVPTILYLRARLRLLRRKSASPRGVIIAHALAILIVSGLAWLSVVPFLSVVALTILLLRAVLGFSRFDKRVTAKKLGLRELCFGAMTVLALVLGHAVGW
ncbi:MAG TPA: YwiC-like family protein [Pyrinomonadaceae bacterium]|nr:YwiC-like family protein [Pyrinomonadaceae bacterium]